MNSHGTENIKFLTTEEICSVYKHSIMTDFPADEQRPLESILELLGEGNYFALGYFTEDSDEPLAYAMFAGEKGSPIFLLDYYAVSPKTRGQGVGGKFLSRFADFLPQKGISHILLEVESLEHASDEDERLIRSRRISFYEKNGCKMTGIKSWLLGVDYSVMLLSFGSVALTDDEVRDNLRAIYKLILTPLVESGNLPNAGKVF